jgi:CheY-like chemotaxis protein
MNDNNSALHATPPSASPPPKGRVLVVDDQATFRYTISALVRALGVTVEEAENGRTALEKLRACKFDVVLLDIQMPEMDGHAVLDVLKNDGALRDVPVIVISGSEDEAARCIEMGAEDLLVKPPNAVLLRARLKACLERKRLRDEELDYLAAVNIVTAAGASIVAGRFDPSRLAEVAQRPDDLGSLARVFQDMAEQIYQRERKLHRKISEDAAIHQIEELRGQFELQERDGESCLHAVDLKNCKVTDDVLRGLTTGLVGVRVLNLSMTEVTDAGLEALRDLNHLESLTLSFLKITDLGLGHLATLSSLTHLDLSVSAITGAGLESLRSLLHLRSLDLSATRIRDASLASLGGLVALEQLDLHMTGIGDAGLAHLSGLRQLRQLDIFSTAVTDLGMGQLAALTQLRILNVGGTSITDAGLVPMQKLEKLSKLQLNDLPITDAGLKSLSCLKGMSDLSLANTSITDAGLVHLHPLRLLEVLDLGGTAVTSRGIAELRKELPRAKVFHENRE